MAKFKIGDSVTIIDGSLETLGVPKGCHGIVKSDDDDEPWVLWDEGDGDKRWCVHEHLLSGNKYQDMVYATAEKYHIGDLYTREDDGMEVYVSGICGTNVFLTLAKNDESMTFLSDKEIMEDYTKKSPESESVELTMDAIADKFGVDVSKLKIKKED